MDKTIDARGMQCPMPVIQTKKALEDMSKGRVTVLVDNAIAVQNLIKMAKQKKLECTSEKKDEDNYIVHMVVTGGVVDSQKADTTTEPPKKPPLNDKSKETTDYETCYPDSRENQTVVVLSSDHMGEGDEGLGKTLMKGFIYALTELEKLPKWILLYNGGAKLSIEGSDSLGDLKLLEAQGVEILTCGTCLNYYDIAEKLSVGTVTNMYAIAEILMLATKIIRP